MVYPTQRIKALGNGSSTVEVQEGREVYPYRPAFVCFEARYVRHLRSDAASLSAFGA